MYYFIYCKGPNEKRFTLCNPWKGTRGMGKVYAPRFLKEQADYAVASPCSGIHSAECDPVVQRGIFGLKIGRNGTN